MRRTIAFGTAALIALIGAGCAEAPTGDPPPLIVTELDGLRFEVALSQPVIPVGDSATVSIRLHNNLAQVARLNFGSTCQILPYVESAAGAILVPGGGAYACGDALTSLEVPAGGSVLRTLVLRGVASGAAGPTGSPSLTPGRYRTYALLDFIMQTQPSLTRRQLRSATVEFEVR